MRIRFDHVVLGVFLAITMVCTFHAVWADPSPVERCDSDDDCDDGLFCNGEELCAPGSTGEDARGCIPDPRNPPPCQEEREYCIEDDDRCMLEGCEDARDRDADGDGHDSIRCGGDDCDDNDGGRYPGNVEVCDEEGHDEDCDPGTYHGPHDGDADGDGFIDYRCWNDLRQF